MLSWWSRKPAVVNRVEDENAELLDAPETPAPVFAARALKSAIFGTPAPPDDTIYGDADDEDEAELKVPKENKGSQARSMSPTKPAGILLTPGTATTRRKTVSFDHDAGEKENDGITLAKPGSKSGIPDDCPGKFPSPWVPKSEARKAKRKTSLTQALEAAREDKPERERSRSRRRSSETDRSLLSDSESIVALTKRERTSEDFLPEVKDVKIESDTTIDLNEPNSKSGKFWKSEYEQYHEEAVIEMKKLINYKELAKSYAQSKDAQAMSLAAKLKQEQEKVAEMESKITKLTAKIDKSGRDGKDEDSSALIKELARQTALAVQYKSQVDEFRVALEENGIEISPRKGGNRDSKSFASPRTEQTILDTRHELRKAREQLKDVTALREEVDRLKSALADALKAGTKLGAENAKLSQEILYADLRLEKHLEKCEAKLQHSEEHKQKKEEAFQNLQKDYDQLKEQAKSSRRESEQLLKKRQDQIADLRKEIASIRGSDSTVQELQQALQKKNLDHERIVEGYKKEIEDLKKNKPSLVLGRLEDGTGRRDEVIISPREWYPPKPSPVRESHIPVAVESISRPLKTFSSKSSLDDESSLRTPRHRASQPALSEIINNANVDTLPPRRYGPVLHTPIAPATPLTGQFSTPPKSPEVTLPCFESTQLVEPAKGAHARNCPTSPRPSMFNIASSPPKAALMRSHTSNSLSRQRSTNDLGSRRLADVESSRQPSNSLSRQRSTNDLGSRRLADVESSRLPSQESARARAPLPPERIAAAKARLEAKAAEKKKAQQALAAGKENVKA